MFIGLMISRRIANGTIIFRWVSVQAGLPMVIVNEAVTAAANHLNIEADLYEKQLVN